MTREYGDPARHVIEQEAAPSGERVLSMAANRWQCLTAVLALLMTPAAAWAQTALPDPVRTPGALNPEVTQETIGTTICVRGWTRKVRPPPAYTHALKVRNRGEPSTQTLIVAARNNERPDAQ
jgi:hypothetical protein